MKKNILPNGFFSAGLSAGIKPDNSLDMALIVSDNIASAAGVFTTNQVYAAPVKLCKEHLVNNQAKAIIVNSGVANACTGKEGYNSAVEMTKETAKHLECNLTDVLVCSTGKIGPQLPMDKIKSGIFNLSKSLSENNLDITSKAIMTTDTHPKIVTKSIFLNNQKITITGVAKGAGMIEPNMATMLAFIMTDAKINSFDLNKCLKDAVDVSFNRITVDGDQSTNDTVLILANGLDDTCELNPNSNEWNDYTIALKEVCFELAMMIVHDGEGADRFITLKVIGALNDEEADIAARSVANSLLNKTAWAGSYPDWGRIMDAIGYSSAKIIPENVSIFYGNVQAVENGCQYDVDHQVMVDAVSEKELLIKVHLGLADGEATIYTCNCTERYVRINY